MESIETEIYNCSNSRIDFVIVPEVLRVGCDYEGNSF